MYIDVFGFSIHIVVIIIVTAIYLSYSFKKDLDGLHDKLTLDMNKLVFDVEKQISDLEWEVYKLDAVGDDIPSKNPDSVEWLERKQKELDNMQGKINYAKFVKREKWQNRIIGLIFVLAVILYYD